MLSAPYSQIPSQLVQVHIIYACTRTPYPGIIPCFMWYVQSRKCFHWSLYLIALYSWYSIHPLVYQSGLVPQRGDDSSHLLVVEVVGRILVDWLERLSLPAHNSMYIMISDYQTVCIAKNWKWFFTNLLCEWTNMAPNYYTIIRWQFFFLMNNFSYMYTRYMYAHAISQV